MSSIIVDTHAHYDDERFAGNTDELFKEFGQNGVKGVITCAVDQYASYKKCRELAEKYNFCYFLAGVHPLNMEDNGKFVPELLCEQLNHKKCLGIGEIGLDYYYQKENREAQINLVKAQLELAVELNKPISFHDRDAHEDTLKILNTYKPKGVVHCFSGSAQMAKEIVKLGLYIGVGGVVTFNNAKKLVQVVEETPLSAILLETDAPYLAPVPNRGKTNRSDYIIHIAEKIAEIKGTTTEAVLQICYDNACSLFNTTF